MRPANAAIAADITVAHSVCPYVCHTRAHFAKGAGQNKESFGMDICVATSRDVVSVETSRFRDGLKTY